MMLILKYLFIAIIAYLLGAIPFGLMLGSRMAKVDIRKYGSGNIGATNVFRTLGTRLGLLTALLDISKAALAVIISMFIIGDEPFMLVGVDVHVQSAQVLAAIMAMVGHNWSPYIGFKGGKGVSCFIGGMLVINWVVALAGLAVGLLVIVITRYVSLGSILAAVCVMLLLLAAALLTLSAPVYIIYGVLAAGLILFQHRSNISRLQAGTELKLGDKGARTR